MARRLGFTGRGELSVDSREWHGRAQPTKLNYVTRAGIVADANKNFTIAPSVEEMVRHLVQLAGVPRLNTFQCRRIGADGRRARLLVPCVI